MVSHSELTNRELILTPLNQYTGELSMGVFLDEVYQRIPEMKQGNEKVNEVLKITPEMHQQYLQTCEEISEYLCESDECSDSIALLNTEMVERLIDKLDGDP